MSAPRTSQISLAEIRSAAAEVLTRHYGSAPPFRVLRRRFSRYSSSYPIQNIRMLSEENHDLHLVLKDLSPGAQFNLSRPRSLYDPQREILVYSDVLTPALHTPAFFGAIVRPTLDRYWLFLERVPGVHLWQIGDFDFWKDAARWLARLHSRSDASDRARRLPPDRLIQYQRDYFTRTLAQAETTISRCTRPLAPSLLRRFGRLVDGYDHALARLEALPLAFIHGDFFASNVLVRTAEPARPIAPIDWELAGIGPGLLDLAALTSGNWQPHDRTAMIAAYREALETTSGWPPSEHELREAVDCSQLQLALQFLGWDTKWRPPSAHCQDWFHVALESADRIGLP
jgi:Ser/Thr protein kinase RdoA (MazF antagonist)